MTWFALSITTLVRDTGPIDGFSFVRHTIHSLELTYLAPSRTTMPLYVKVAQCLRKFTRHPVYVSCTTDIT